MKYDHNLTLQLNFNVIILINTNLNNLLLKSDKLKFPKCLKHLLIVVLYIGIQVSFTQFILLHFKATLSL